jgi:peptidoglycan/LPS O-acetylase OafA/YrhL
LIRRYLPEVDTLRAIAVMLVVLFHGYPALVPTGFLGVDIFFVISGYVISRAYLFPVLERRTTLADFYSSRFRRLAPALLLTVLLTAVTSFVLLKPADLAIFGKSLILQPFYLQNFSFWLGGDALTPPLANPLLNTWNLAVEEQFYLLLAGLCLLTATQRQFFWPLLTGAAALSFVFYLVYGTMGVSPHSAFFLLPGRFWQLALGVLVFGLVRKIREANQPHRPLLSTVLVATILLAPLVPAPPGPLTVTVKTLVACVATAGALALFELDRDHYAVLRVRAIRYLGKISYALYLWHWPLLSLAVAIQGRLLTPVEATIALLIAVLLASLTYHLVEMPIRERRVIRNRRVLLVVLLLASTAVLAMATAILLTSGTFR